LFVNEQVVGKLLRRHWGAVQRRTRASFDKCFQCGLRKYCQR